MKAIDRLLSAGYTRQQIAEQMPGKTGQPLIRLYERGLRFPGRKHFVCIVEMAEAVGIELTARDFLEPGGECEPNGVAG